MNQYILPAAAFITLYVVARRVGQLDHRLKQLENRDGKTVTVSKNDPELVHEGDLTFRIYQADSGNFVIADQAGWLPGSFKTRDAALVSARKANGMD